MGRGTGDDIGEGPLKGVDKLFVRFLRTSPISVSSISVEAGEGGQKRKKRQESECRMVSAPGSSVPVAKHCRRLRSQRRKENGSETKIECSTSGSPNKTAHEDVQGSQEIGSREQEILCLPCNLAIGDRPNR